MNILERLMEANIVSLERPEREFVTRWGPNNEPLETRMGIANEYVFYRNDNRFVLGSNTYIALETIPFYTELRARLNLANQERS